MEKFDEYLGKLGLNEFEKIKPLKEFSQKIGVKVAHIVLAFFSILLIFVVLEFGSFLITSLVGFVYPAYMSFKAVESTETSDDTQWLTYWVVYSFFTVFNDMLFIVLGFIPFLYIIKAVLYVWMFHPRTKGAQVIYEKVIKPLLLKYEGKLDRVTNRAEEGMAFLAEQGKNAREFGGDLAKKTAVDTAFANLTNKQS